MVTSSASESLTKKGIINKCSTTSTKSIPPVIHVHDQKLANGHALGCIVFNPAGVKLRCTTDCIGGRGLRVLHAVKKGVLLARGTGKIVDCEKVLNNAAYKLHDSKNKVLLLDAPSRAFPANLANTSDGEVANNCELVHRSGCSFFSIKTKRPLKAGEEVIVPYGAKFTKHVRAQVNQDKERIEESMCMLNKLPLKSLQLCAACGTYVGKCFLKYNYELKQFIHVNKLMCYNAKKKHYKLADV